MDRLMSVYVCFSITFVKHTSVSMQWRPFCTIWFLNWWRHKRFDYLNMSSDATLDYQITHGKLKDTKGSRYESIIHYDL